mmetsp:Transcript_6104/g.13940  ORF Transcript_6104/g.13940 Transcript_6104/m.13940 type:complete len:157 (+) Transcript_6104:104-574(+)
MRLRGLVFFLALRSVFGEDASCFMQSRRSSDKVLDKVVGSAELQDLAHSATGLVNTLATLQRSLHAVRPARAELMSLPPDKIKAVNDTASEKTNFIVKLQRLSPRATLVAWVLVLTPLWLLAGWCLFHFQFSSRMTLNSPSSPSVRRTEARGWDSH